MDIELIRKLDELINIFDNDPTIKRVEELKKDIYDDKDLSNKLHTFNNTDIYGSNYLELKKDIMDNPKIKEFKKYETELILLTMSINKKLNTLTRKKGCIHENN